jgi:hypothetical protein
MSHGVSIHPSAGRKTLDAFTKPSQPRWYRVQQKDPGRWIHHDPPLQGHYAAAACTVCIYDPPPPSWGMLDEADEAVEALAKENKDLKARIGDGGAERFNEVLAQRDELSDLYDRSKRTIQVLERRLDQAMNKPQPKKKPWWRR